MLEAIRTLSLIFSRDPLSVVRAHENRCDFAPFIAAVRDADPELALAAIQFWQSFLLLETVVYKDDFRKRVFEQYALLRHLRTYRLLPLLLEQCKMKSEDFEKFLKDKQDAEVLQRKKQISRSTIRSKAANAIEKLSSKKPPVIKRV